MTFEQKIHIRSTYTRSINLTRDSQNPELIHAYIPTQRGLQALEWIAEGLHEAASERALALIGPYGSGKSLFALYLGALLDSPTEPAFAVAHARLQSHQPALAGRYLAAMTGRQGFLRVQVSGIPDSLVRQLLLALGKAAEKARLPPPLTTRIKLAAKAGTPLDQALTLFQAVQNAWAECDGCGVLLEIDELGKFLEYESYHPQYREIHLLQLLAEHAHSPHKAPLHIVVMLHQSFEQHSRRLGKTLRDEWQKVQGRFKTLAFLESPEQAIRLIAEALHITDGLPLDCEAGLKQVIDTLDTLNALPEGLTVESAYALLARCYPLHPLTTLILPVLCQKAAQNERTLFTFLSSREPFGLPDHLARLEWGEWVEPWRLYDYFFSGDFGGFADPLTQHRWIEVATALERLDDGPAATATHLLKTIGLFNLIGQQRGLKACKPLLQRLFGPELDAHLSRLMAASLIHFRHFSQEYRVWQGSDFDLSAAVQQIAAQYEGTPLDELLNALSPLNPVMVRRASIATGSLRSFTPVFTSKKRWPPANPGGDILWLYLLEPQEFPGSVPIPPDTPAALCEVQDRLREAVFEWIALREIPQHHPVLQQDSIAHREHRVWLEKAETEALTLIHGFIEQPDSPQLQWFWGEQNGKREYVIHHRRQWQKLLSDWVEKNLYPKAPLFHNELINRDQPSASANTGRKRLLEAMLKYPDKDHLGIEKTPAEKSLYLSLLKASGLHRQQAGTFGFYPPDPMSDPCRVQPVWTMITNTLGQSGEQQIPLTRFYEILSQKPFGVKTGVLPVLMMAYILANRREVAVYQEGVFCETLTIEHAEMLCRRPQLFGLERFTLEGVRAELFERYLKQVIGGTPEEATLLDIVRPLVRFMATLPEYTQHCINLSAQAKAIRTAFQQAQSPGLLLFEAIPKACGVDLQRFQNGDTVVVEDCVQRLVQVLRELKRAYPELLETWHEVMKQALLDTPSPELATTRSQLAKRYQGLERYTPDRMGLGALARRLADTAYEDDLTWLESIATLIARTPPTKWREETRVQAVLTLKEKAQQLRDLESLRLSVADNRPEGAMLLKIVDAEQGERSRTIHLTDEQQHNAIQKANDLHQHLNELDETERLAVVAELVKRYTQTSEQPYE